MIDAYDGLGVGHCDGYCGCAPGGWDVAGGGLSLGRTTGSALVASGSGWRLRAWGAGRRIGELSKVPGMTCGGWQLRPESRGTVLAKSANPADAPAIKPNYLDHEVDRRAIVSVLRWSRNLLNAPVFAGCGGDEVLPGRGTTTDEEFLAYARANGTTVYHPGI